MDSHNKVVKLGAGFYRIDIPEDAHAFDVDSSFLYYWRLKESDVKVSLPMTGKWTIHQEHNDHIILKLNS